MRYIKTSMHRGVFPFQNNPVVFARLNASWKVAESRAQRREEIKRTYSGAKRSTWVKTLRLSSCYSRRGAWRFRENKPRRQSIVWLYAKMNPQKSSDRFEVSHRKTSNLANISTVWEWWEPCIKPLVPWRPLRKKRSADGSLWPAPGSRCL